jgi:hypothetical protein
MLRDAVRIAQNVIWLNIVLTPVLKPVTRRISAIEHFHGGDMQNAGGGASGRM